MSFVIYIRQPYEGISKIIGVCNDRVDVDTFVSFLTETCQNIEDSKIDDVIDFAATGGLILDRSIISNIKYGAYIKYQKVQEVGNWDYSYWNNTFLCEYDHFTSDFEYIPDELDCDYDFDYATGTRDSVQVLGNLRTKLIGFNKPQSYKKYDASMANPEIMNRNPLKVWSSHTGFKKERNHIIRMIEKEVKVCQSLNKLNEKIKGNIKYRKCNIYRSAANCYLKTLECYDESWWDYMLPGFILVGNTVWRKTKMFQFLGYGYKEQRCFIDGRIRTRLIEIELN